MPSSSLESSSSVAPEPPETDGASGTLVTILSAAIVVCGATIVVLASLRQAVAVRDLGVGMLFLIGGLAATLLVRGRAI
jgi:hypothetical protein